MTDEVQTCPRRGEGPRFAPKSADRWEFRNWKFTNPDDAKRFNDEEARQKNEEAKERGWNTTHTSNPRYWLWPGPGPMPRTCSFCGGIHPEDAIRLRKDFGFLLGGTTKSYKLYIELPNGGTIYPPLKAYSQHFTDEQWIELTRGR